MLLKLIFVSVFNFIFAFPGQKDEVIILPGLKFQPDFKHYSGYLNGSDTHMLHYWFVTSQNSANRDPLVLWLNGGPGCSSLDGLLNENGPFQMTETGYLRYNKYSWNQMANIIYLESPTCVGFSYSTNGKCNNSDDSTARINYNALKHFYVKFPHFKYREFYITGESYGGIYVPTLAVEIIRNAKKVPYFNLKGIAIGNALSSYAYGHNGLLHYSYNHGLVSDRLWSEIITTCCNNVDPLHCNLTRPNNTLCQQKVASAIEKFENINFYNIYSKCVTASSSMNRNQSLWSRLNVSSNYERYQIIMGWNIHNNDRLKTLRQKFMIMEEFPTVFKVSKKRAFVIPCFDSSVTTNYLNDRRVRYALNIPVGLPPWSICSRKTNNNYKRNYDDMTKQYDELFKLNNFKIWIYNGDLDMVCSYLSDEWYFGTFNRKLIKERQAWMYKDERNSSQVGGFITIFDKMSLLTVRGAGHMVPGDKPIPALHLFRSFITGTNISTNI